uniref:Uncharacterized protein n=1 Tax=Arundo donax TaxID=35708 RepID=A0A0A9B8P3_ARUDO
MPVHYYGGHHPMVYSHNNITANMSVFH